MRLDYYKTHDTVGMLHPNNISFVYGFFIFDKI